MRVQTLDGNEYNLIIKEKFKNLKKSKGHIKCRELLKIVYPTVKVIEECPIKVIKGKTLYLDFFIPIFKIAIEIDGDQHDNYNQFLHKNKLHYIACKKNDRLKEEFCELNNIRLIRLNDRIKEWETAIRI